MGFKRKINGRETARQICGGERRGGVILFIKIYLPVDFLLREWVPWLFWNRMGKLVPCLQAVVERHRALSAPMGSLLPSGNTPYARVSHLGDAVPWFTSNTLLRNQDSTAQQWEILSVKGRGQIACMDVHSGCGQKTVVPGMMEVGRASLSSGVPGKRKTGKWREKSGLGVGGWGGKGPAVSVSLLLWGLCSHTICVGLLTTAFQT